MENTKKPTGSFLPRCVKAAITVFKEIRRGRPGSKSPYLLRKLHTTRGSLALDVILGNVSEDRCRKAPTKEDPFQKDLEDMKS
ncbi:hypothetical protein IFR05_012035 [Cadophora sp. M221]|nr:hypothetical protein IFR05_012035 [Cadophora sp. M221]